eukprot:7921959-Prorocentrum_lima.AAC.1
MAQPGEAAAQGSRPCQDREGALPDVQLTRLCRALVDRVHHTLHTACHAGGRFDFWWSVLPPT